MKPESRRYEVEKSWRLGAFCVTFLPPVFHFDEDGRAFVVLSYGIHILWLRLSHSKNCTLVSQCCWKTISKLNLVCQKEHKCHENIWRASLLVSLRGSVARGCNASLTYFWESVSRSIVVCWRFEKFESMNWNGLLNRTTEYAGWERSSKMWDDVFI